MIPVKLSAIATKSVTKSLLRACAPALVAALAGAALAGLLPGAAQAQSESATSAAPILTIGLQDAALSRKVDLTRGRSIVVDLPRDAKEVFVANPAVADSVVRSTRKVFVIGKEEGATSIFIMDAEGNQIAALDVVVARELKLNLLRQTLQQSFPDARFEVRSAGDSIILSGSVASAADAARAFDLANAFVGTSGLGGAPSTGGGPSLTRGAVINNLSIREKDQVMLRVTVVEVARTVLKQFGINLKGEWSPLKFENSMPFPLSSGQSPSGNLIQGTLNGPGGVGLTATLRAFEQAGVSRVLAEPMLTAISGESAKFLAGGKIPVPSSSNCTAGGGCTPGIIYQPYGVSLTFTPVVLSESRISIRVGTEVSEIDRQNSFTYVNTLTNIAGQVFGGESTAVPGLTLRNTETTVELPSGSTMVTAGLIQQRNRAAISGLPGLINLPVLGALFRSRDYQRQETELLIMVTPYIAKPMAPAKVARPDDGFTDVNDAQGVLLGRINRIYGVAGGSGQGRGYRGRVGFIND